MDGSSIRSDTGGFAVALSKSSTGSSGALSVGASHSTNEIGKGNGQAVRAFIDNSNVEANGDVSLTATSTAEIDALSIGGALAGAKGGRGLSIALAGAGAGTVNTIDIDVEAAITQSTVDTTGANSNVKLLAKDTSSIRAEAVGASLSVSVGDQTSVAVAVGVSIATNTITNEAQAYIDDESNINAGTGTVDVKAEGSASIEALSVAASLAIAVGGKAAISLSGGGSDAFNVIHSTKANAYVDNSTIAAGDLTLTGTSESTINSTVVAVAAGAGAIGASRARNFIGWDASDNKMPSEIQAYARNSAINLTGDLTADATSKQVIDAKVGAGSVAISGAPEGNSLALGGAGVDTRNKTNVLTQAYLEGGGSKAISADSISLNADDSSSISAIAAAAAIAASFASSNAGAVAVGVALAENEISNSSQAFIREATSVTTTEDDITISATSTGRKLFDFVPSAVAVTNLNNAGTQDEDDDQTESVNEAATDALADARILKQLRSVFSSNSVTIPETAFAHMSDETDLDGINKGARVKIASGADSDIVYEYQGDTIEAGTPVNLTSAPFSDFSNASLWRAVDDASVTTLQQGEEWTVSTSDGAFVLRRDVNASGGTVFRVFESNIEAISVAASVALSFSGSNAAGFSGAGAESTNRIFSKTNAFVEDSTLNSNGDVDVNAASTAAIVARVAAVSAAAGVGNNGAGLSIGAAVARNEIGWGRDDKDVTVHHSTSDKQQSNIILTPNVTNVKIEAGPRVGDIYQYIGAEFRDDDGNIKAETIDFRLLDYSDTEKWKLINAKKVDTQLRAFAKNSSIIAMGDLSLKSTAASSIDAGVGAGSLAVGGGGNVGVGLSGAGVSTHNRISMEVASFIEGDRAGGIRADNITIAANDTSTIKATAAAASVALGLAGNVGVSISIGVSLAFNEISNDVKAYIKDVRQQVIATGDVDIDANESASIDALSVAVSLSVGVGVGAAGVALSGAGANATNIVNNHVQAFIQNSIVRTHAPTYQVADTPAEVMTGDTVELADGRVFEFTGSTALADSDGVNLAAQAFSNTALWSPKSFVGSVFVNALSNTSVTSLVGAASSAVAAGTYAGVAGSIGVSLARNLIGFRNKSDSEGKKNKVHAYISNDSDVTSAGGIKVHATTIDKLSATSFAGSVAISGGIGAVSLAGAGAEATNWIGTEVLAYAEDSKLTALGVGLTNTSISSPAIDIQAKSESEVEQAISIGAALSVAIGAGAGVSVSASTVDNKIAEDIKAYIAGNSTERDVIAMGDVSVQAISDASLGKDNGDDIEITAVSASVAGGAFAFAGGGIDIDNKIANNVHAYVQGPLDVDVVGELKVNAQEDAFVEADAGQHYRRGWGHRRRCHWCRACRQCCRKRYPSLPLGK